MRNIVFATITAMFIACGGAAPSSQSGRASLEDKAASTLRSMTAKDRTLQPFLDRAAGYVVFPNIGKGGLIVGGAHGRGVLYQHHHPVGFVELSQASFGAQAGAESFAELIVFERQADIERVRGNSYTMGGNVSAVALSAGAGAATQFQNGVSVFIEPHGGVMAELSVHGQQLKFAEGG
jgi:lipid-binding SYLF domain-containing protein